MEIFGGLSQPVNFYTKNTGNSINTALNEENQAYSSNIFAPVSQIKTQNTQKTLSKRRKRNKRLNINDNDYLPEEYPIESKEISADNNFFMQRTNPSFITNFKKAVDHFFTSVPLINYFYLKNKSKLIGNTVERLSSITQDVDDILNSPVPYGEANSMYEGITDNLKNAAEIIAEANKKF